MIDGVIAGTGKSRYLKSDIAADTTYEDFLTALRAGTLQIDLNGVNAAGWTQLGSALSKANILPDATATLLKLVPANDPQVKDAFNNLAVLSGSSAPTTSIVGVVGQFYLDTATGLPYQCTAVAGSVHTWTALKPESIYEKIREIPDANALNNLSIDLSDIDWEIYDEIRLTGRVWTDSPDIYLRFNNLSAASYSTSYMKAGSAYAYANTQTSILLIDAARPAYPARFDLSITKHKVNTSTYWEFNLNKSGGNSSNLIAVSRYNATQAELSTLNFVAASTPFTVSISGVMLWGMKK